ncbi:hypothetical protein GCM10007923_55450 [Shinella yambaruensis]|uniref:Uncharacterized protein n=1 Tax=Shinella yambaruensis TaxID=415996 RepID=A0ABQ5ZNB1_9HYPH|nr:hypothetical protein GCM10007923_55450 [Shinella yambaruensis]
MAGGIIVRVIIRFSVDNENNSALRNKLTGVLTRAGLVRGANTATYEAMHLTSGNVGHMLSAFWRRANNHQGPGRIDHFWMYSDKSDLDDIV